MTLAAGPLLSAACLADGSRSGAARLGCFVLLIETVDHHFGDVEFGMVEDHFAIEGGEDLVGAGLILRIGFLDSEDDEVVVLLAVRFDELIHFGVAGGVHVRFGGEEFLSRVATSLLVVELELLDFLLGIVAIGLISQLRDAIGFGLDGLFHVHELLFLSLKLRLEILGELLELLVVGEDLLNIEEEERRAGSTICRFCRLHRETYGQHEARQGQSAGKEDSSLHDPFSFRRLVWSMVADGLLPCRLTLTVPEKGNARPVACDFLE